MIAQSSPIRRVIESSQSLLAGLFAPPRVDQVWSDNDKLATLWQPIAVSTESVDESYVIGEGGKCPVADKISSIIQYPQFLMHPLVQQLWNESQGFVQQLTKYSGINITSVGAIAGLYDTLICEQDYFGSTFKRPSWLDLFGPENEAIERMRPFREIGFQSYGWLSTEFLRLKAGPFLKEMSHHLNETANNFINNNNNGKQLKQLFTYGTHDTVMSVILHALGFFKG